MRKSATSGIAAAMAMALVATTSVTPAEAGKGNVAGAVIAGVVVGGIVAGAIATSKPRYYSEPVGCSDYRRRAIADERMGRPDKAQFWWDSYAACRRY